MTREEAINWLNFIKYHVDNKIMATFDDDAKDAIYMAIEALSADAVEVVRCKDCKHKYVSGNGTTQYYVCDFMDAQYEEYGFCHHGKAR